MTRCQLKSLSGLQLNMFLSEKAPSITCWRKVLKVLLWKKKATKTVEETTTCGIYWCYATTRSHQEGSHIITLPLCQASITDTLQRDQGGCNPSVSPEITPKLSEIISSQESAVMYAGLKEARVSSGKICTQSARWLSQECVIRMKGMVVPPFQSNTLNKLLMIKQIETARNNSLHSWWMAPHIRNSWVMRLRGLFHYCI